MPSGKIWIQENLLLGYTEGAGKLSVPVVEYVNCEEENGSDGGTLAESEAVLAWWMISEENSG